MQKPPNHIIGKIKKALIVFLIFMANTNPTHARIIFVDDTFENDSETYEIGTDDDAASTNLTLQFGGTNGETFSWDFGNTEFDLSDDLNVTGSVTGTSITDGTTTLTGGAINGATSVDATTENTIEAAIFDADAENISGTWEVQDDTPLRFGNDADVSIFYDEATNDGLEISGTNANVFIEDNLIVNTNGTVNGTFDANGIATIGDNGDTITLDSSDWDISATGDFSGAGTITADGLITGTAGATLSGAAISLNANSNFAVNVATGTSTGAVTIGGGSNTVEVNSSDWDISTTGDLTGIGSITADGLLDIGVAGENIEIGDGSAANHFITFNDGSDHTIGWDNSRTSFNLSADLDIEGTTFTLDVDEAGNPDQDISIVAEQGSESNGTLRYDDGNDQWELSNNGGAFAAITVDGSTDFEDVYTNDAGNNLDTSNGIFTVTTGTNDFVVDSNDWNVTSGGALDATSLSDGTTTLTGGAINGATGVDATTENTIEATIFDADAESITGVWEVQDDTAFQFGTDGDVLIQYDEATDNRLEISGTNANVFIEDDLIVNTDATVNGTFDANGVVTIGDNGDTVAIDSSDWDISATGDQTGIGAITMDGLLTGTAGATLSGAVINLNASSNFAVNIGTGSTTAAVTVGGNSNTVEINSSNWDVSTTGVASGLTGITSTGTIDFSGATNIIIDHTNDTTFTLDNDNGGGGANIDIVAEQGTDNNGTLRYDATANQWQINNDAAGFNAVHMANVFYTYDNTGNQAITGTEITLNWDSVTETITDSNYTFSAANDTIEFNEDGLYKITVNVGSDSTNTSGAARGTVEITIQEDPLGVGAFADIPGALTRCYQRETTSNSCRTGLIRSFTATDEIRVRLVRIDGTTNTDTEVDGSHILVERIR